MSILSAMILAAMASMEPVFINGPVVRKVLVNEKPIEGRVTWKVTGLGVFTCAINGHEVGAEDWLKPGYTHVKKRRDVFTYDVTDLLNKEAGATNVLTATVTSGWWSDKMMGKNAGKRNAFWGELKAGGTVLDATGAGWEASEKTPVIAGIWEGEKYDAGDAMGTIASTRGWAPAVVNTEFKGELTPVVGAQVRSRAPIAVVKSWKVENRTIYDFGQNHAGVPHFTLKGKPGATFRYRLGEMLNDGVKGHHGDGPKNTVYLANLRGAATNMWYRFEGARSGEEGARSKEQGASVVEYVPKYSFYGYRYLQLEDNPDVELVKVESVPLSSVTKELERGTLKTSQRDLQRLIDNAYWGMRSNYLSIPTDCPQRSERYGWTGDTQVFSETAGYFMDTRSFFEKWTQDLRDTQFDDGLYPDVAPLGAFGAGGGQAAWSDAGIVVPYRVWRQTGDTKIVRENWAAMMKFVDYMLKTGYEMKRGGWLLADWLSFEKLSVDQRTRWKDGSCTEDHLSYQNFLNACYAVSDCEMMREMGAGSEVRGAGCVVQGADERFIDAAESKFRAKIAATWLQPDGSLIPLFDGMMTPRLMALKIGAGDIARHHRELVEIIRKNGNRLATGFVGTSELTEQLSRVGEYGVVWDILLNHAFPGWLYSVDQGATTIWERWNGYTNEKGFGDVGMNSYNHYAYGSVVGWLYKYAAGIQPGKDGGYKSFTLAPHPDKRAGSLKAVLDTPEGRIVSHWWYEGDQLHWEYEVPKNAKVEIVRP